MENSIPEGKGRLGWFDAMRGLAIVLVVLGHVLLLSFGIKDVVVLRLIIKAFHMPLFFFISGFFAYKACESWTLARVGNFAKRKVQSLLICALIFYGLFQFSHGESVFSLLSDGPGRYWFTIVLFQMFVVFLALSLLSKFFRSEHILAVGLILVSIVGEVVLTMKLLDSSTLWTVLKTEHFCFYFQFFALGIFCRKYREHFEGLLSKNWFKAVIMICAVVCLVLCYHDGFRNYNALLYGLVRFIPTSYALLLVVVAFFFAKREFFEAPSATSSALRYIGQRTLDIYMLHWFFLPDLNSLNAWLVTGNMFIPQLAIGLVVSALIIALCLLLGEILRLSSFLSSWLFGVKPRAQN